jgi:lysophospholipid acyltransferase (LPLAT)-like uncharacterized protein
VTSKWDILGKEHPHPFWEKNKPVIACFWHGRLLMMFKSWFGQHKLHVLISSHIDGQIIARTTQHFGFGWIAGSSSKGGRKAVLSILKTLKNGESVGVTPDGPRGPRYQVSLGIIQMARLGNVALLPVSYSSRRGIFMKSWDRFLLPLPFDRGVFIYGPRIDVTNSPKSDEELRQQLEKSLKDLTLQADLYCGREASKCA